MTAKANHSTSATTCPTPLVLFGIDSRGKPKGARFGKEHASLAIKAATQLQLQVLAGNDPKIAEIAARLPVGRVHATGRTFVPFIRRDLYDQLLAAAAQRQSCAAASAAGQRSERECCRVAATGVISQAAAELAGDRRRRSGPLRKDVWRTAGTRPSSSQLDGDMFTLRWRDYPRQRRFVAPSAAARLALSGTQTERRDRQIGESLRPAQSTTNSRNKSAANGPALPKDWDEIDLNHLVLAKTEGPWANWFEAIPIERAGDGFKLRWRDYGSLPPAIRPRFDLALICPDAA